MPSSFLLQSLILISSLLKFTSAECRSTGTDYLDGGGPYCLNTTSTDYFSFGTEWTGCSPSDSQGGVTPILIAPNTDEYFCSDIQTNPDSTNMQSTCNVPGSVLTKDKMVTGNWTIVLEGLTFAWMRVFALNAAPPVTVTSTPTATFTVIRTPSATTTQTNTVVTTTSIPAKTTTVPATTLTRTVTITPRPVTITTTSFLYLTLYDYAFATTINTVTVTTSCQTRARPFDRLCTITPKRATLAAKTGIQARAAEASTAVPLMPGGSRYQRNNARAQEWRREAERRGIQARTIDACTATVIATSNLPSTTITVTAPTTTITVITDVTVISTVTPPVSTIYSGQATTTITTTKPTETFTRTYRGITNTVVTKTWWATVTKTVKVKPTGVYCNA